MRRTLRHIAADLESGKATSEGLVEECLAQIRAPEGEGKRVFLSVSANEAIAAARAMDQLRRAKAAPSPFAGIPISTKDIFDIQGEVTRAGSRALDDAPKATADADAVAYLRCAGFILIGRTNMTEFAFSGLGINPHFGTPLNAWDRKAARIPGGSSSGAAISVTDAMAHGALGTDTGGSARIPAAFNGLAGFKPTARRVSRTGCIPLSTTLDSIGPIARSVECCAILDGFVAGEPATISDRPVSGLRLAVPKTIVLDDLDPHVARSFSAAISRLSLAGAKIEDLPFQEFASVASMNAKGGFAAAESYYWHHDLLAAKGDKYDPRVRSRIERGKLQSASDYIELQNRRSDFIRQVANSLRSCDAIICPTVPIIPPRINDLDRDDDFTRINLLALRNPTLINMFDGCAISIPIHLPDQAPVGLMIAAGGNQDKTLLEIAAAVERDLMLR